MQRVLLVGLAASGKSTVADAIAASTGWPCLDNDLVLERSAGCSAEQLLAQRGDDALRSAEADVLTLTLSMPPPLVAGVAASVVLDAGNRQRLRSGGHVVWLRASVTTLARRLAKAPHPTFPAGNRAAALRAMARERDPLYAEVAHQVLDMDVLAPALAARQVVEAVRS